MRRVMWQAGVLALVGGVVVAAQPSGDALQRCAQVKDSLERLVCYDRAAAAGTSAPAAPATPAAPVAPPVVTPPAPVVQAVPSAPVAAPAAREFGDETVKRTEKERVANSGPTSLTAQVAGMKEYRRNVYVLTLDNGQVWQQMDMDSLFTVKVGDTIQIEKGKLGGYRMARTSDGRSGWVRVNRVK
jgi:hypothetical protein